MKSLCPYCDPKHFVIYGYCRNCSRRCEPPLYANSGKISLQEYDEFCKKWNDKRDIWF